jgi:hypothetical protein
MESTTPKPLLPKNNGAPARRSLFVRSLTRVFVADVAFTIIPLIVIGLITWLSRGDLTQLYLAPDISFATIVFFGLALAQYVEFQTIHGARNSSWSLLSGTRVLTLLLIISVVILSLVVVRNTSRDAAVAQAAPAQPPAAQPAGGQQQKPPEAKAAASTGANALFVAQILMFVLSLVFLVGVHHLKEKMTERKMAFPEDIKRSEFYFYCRQSIRTATEEVLYLSEMLRRSDSFECFRDGSVRPLTDTEKYDLNEAADKLTHAYETLGKHIGRLSAIEPQEEKKGSSLFSVAQGGVA